MNKLDWHIIQEYNFPSIEEILLRRFNISNEDAKKQAKRIIDNYKNNIFEFIIYGSVVVNKE